MTAWRNRIVGHGEEAPDQLLANPRNWRIHPKAQQAALAGALNEVGWVQDIIVNQRSGHIIDGHARVALAISREEASVPVVYVDLDEREEGIVLATIDPLSAMAGSDYGLLGQVLDGIVADGPLGELLDDLNMAAESSTLKSPERNLGKNASLIVRAVFSVEQLETIETAINMTGLHNRGDALVAIAAAFIGGVR